MNTRRVAIGLHDAGMTVMALLVSFLLRWGASEFLQREAAIVAACALTLPFALGSYWFLRIDRSPWKFVSLSDLGTIALAVGVPALFLVLVDFLSRGALIVPRTVPVIYWLVQMSLLVGPRVAYRAYRNRRRDRRAFKGLHRVPVLIAGTDDEANQLVTRLKRDSITSLEVVGFLAGKPRQVGLRIQQVPILGTMAELEAVLRALQAREVRPRRLILTRDALGAPGVDDLLVAARRAGLAVVRLSDVLTGIGAADGPVKLAPVSIDDLLGRPAREIDLSPVRALVSGRRVAVTGAGGSIGSELCRQAAAMGASALLLFDNSELALWGIARELGVLHADVPATRHLGSVCDRTEIGRAFSTFRPEIVFHAAALKHVDIVEAHPAAGAETNTLGTEAVAEAAASAGASCAVFISTDKAVDPVSVLGATKRAGEHVWAAHDRRARAAGDATRFVVVRFGNVLGSSGSVIPLFSEQLKEGGPITVTHPDVERYFMTISEAVRLVLMASSLGQDARETSPTYVLDMGQPVKIIDLARRMIRLAGLEPGREIEIVVTGLRAGERLQEALETSGERLRPTIVEGLRAADAAQIDDDSLARRLDALRTAVRSHDDDNVRRCLNDLVPEYRPQRPEAAL